MTSPYEVSLKSYKRKLFSLGLLSTTFSYRTEKNENKTRKHSSRMHTDRDLTTMSSDRVAMRPIVDRMTDACENITFPCGR